MTHSPRLRVTLRWIDILQTFDPFFKTKGEFRFVAIVTAHGHPPVVTMLPEMGHISIGSALGENRITFDTLLFDGPVDAALTVDITGEEVDMLSRNEQLPPYRRTFHGDPTAWIGRQAPGDETPGHDPENLRSWRLCYDIEAA
jgi:hypothetical protein